MYSPFGYKSQLHPITEEKWISSQLEDMGGRNEFPFWVFPSNQAFAHKSGSRHEPHMSPLQKF